MVMNLYPWLLVNANFQIFHLHIFYIVLCMQNSLIEMARFTTDIPTNITTPKMVTTYLQCKIEDLKPFETVSWIRLKDDQILTVGHYKFTNDPRINVLLQTKNKWNLQIRYTRPDDAGLYECQVGTTGSKKISQVFNLHVGKTQVVNMRRSERPEHHGGDTTKRNVSHYMLDSTMYFPGIYLDAQFTLNTNSSSSDLDLNILYAILTIFSLKNLVSLIILSLF